MEDADTAVDKTELHVMVQVDDDTGDDTANVEDVQDCDGDEDGGEKTPEIPAFSVLDDDHEKEEIEDESNEGEE